MSMVEILVQHHDNSEVNVKNKYGVTALHRACRKVVLNVPVYYWMLVLIYHQSPMTSTHPCMWLLSLAMSPVWSCYCVEGLRFNGRGTNPRYIWLRSKVTLL